jgi:hypothetical protein
MEPHQVGAAKARERFAPGAIALYKTLQGALSKSSITALEFGELCLENTARATEKHNTSTDPEFYNELFDSVCASLQEPSRNNILLASALNYMSEIRFAGYGPRFSTSIALAQDSVLEDVEPLFDVVVQDEDVIPEETLAFRFSITKNLDVRFNPFNLGFLSEKPKTAREIEKSLAKPITPVKSKVKKATRK